MKKQIYKLGLVAFLGLSAMTFAQVGINIEGPEATLDVTAKTTSGDTAEGILIPRVTKAKAEAMGANVAESTLIYIKETAGAAGTYTANVNAKGFYYFAEDNKWKKVGGAGELAASNGLTKDGSALKLGGTLSEDTSINLNNHPLTFKGGEIRNSASGFRWVATDWGMISRIDNSDFYLLPTAQGDALGGWSSERPFRYSFAKKVVSLNASANGGNVGIGTENPTERLEVSGAIKSTALKGVGTRNVTVDENGKLIAGEAISSGTSNENLVITKAVKVVPNTTDTGNGLLDTAAEGKNLRNYSGTGVPDYADSDYMIVLTNQEVDGKLQLPSAAANPGRIIYLINGTQSSLDFAGTGDGANDVLPFNFATIATRAGVAFVSTGKTWYTIGR